jgi:hypothetical protein
MLVFVSFCPAENIPFNTGKLQVNDPAQALTAKSATTIATTEKK